MVRGTDFFPVSITAPEPAQPLRLASVENRSQLTGYPVKKTPVAHHSRQVSTRCESESKDLIALSDPECRLFQTAEAAIAAGAEGLMCAVAWQEGFDPDGANLRG